MNLRRHVSGGALSKLIVRRHRAIQARIGEERARQVGNREDDRRRGEELPHHEPAEGSLQRDRIRHRLGDQAEDRILVPGHKASRVVAALSSSASDGDCADERLFVSDVAEVAGFRGVRGSDAL